MTQDDGVTVGGGFGHIDHGRDTGTARFVFDIHTHAQLFGELGSNRTGHNFTGATRCKGHHKTNGFARPIAVGLGSRRHEPQTTNRQCRGKSTHLAAIEIFHICHVCLHGCNQFSHICWQCPFFLELIAAQATIDGNHRASDVAGQGG